MVELRIATLSLSLSLTINGQPTNHPTEPLTLPDWADMLPLDRNLTHSYYNIRLKVVARRSYVLVIISYFIFINLRFFFYEQHLTVTQKTSQFLFKFYCFYHSRFFLMKFSEISILLQFNYEIWTHSSQWNNKFT